MFLNLFFNTYVKFQYSSFSGSNDTCFLELLLPLEFPIQTSGWYNKLLIRINYREILFG